jgi:very-short-patch-repair endonuclease
MVMGLVKCPSSGLAGHLLPVKNGEKEKGDFHSTLSRLAAILSKLAAISVDDSFFPSPRSSRGEGARRADEGQMRKANTKSTNRARNLRRSQTDAENKIWAELRGRRLNGYKFVRQQPIGPYFADFACREKMLVVELDGSQHAENGYDALRDEMINAEGWSVLRFWNADAFVNLSSVLETILAALNERLEAGFAAHDLAWKPALKAPYPPFGHLLPVKNGEKKGKG